MKLRFYNTISKAKEDFSPIEKGKVKMYTCGPTVYDYAHIGNLRSYVFEDVLKRTLIFNGYQVRHVMNITDVGHLTSDADEGEDKIEAKARQEKKSADYITKKFTEKFFQDIKKLNILKPDIIAKATEHIKDQIDFIEKLEKKGLTYQTKDGVYFDTSKFKKYPDFARLDIEGLQAGARVKLKSQKKNITDFALWKFSGKDINRQQEWDSPWGIGFPGWHLECSTMSMKYLGEQIDIHCGGIEHIPTHHTNEIAQSESLTGKQFVNYWLHNEHLLINGQKMSKSKGNFTTLTDLIKKNNNPLAYRYLLLTTHYRSKINFTWKSMASVQQALDNIYHKVKNLNPPGKSNQKYLNKFNQAINDDLNTPKALAIFQGLLKSKLSEEEISATLLEFDKVLGLDLAKTIKEKPTITEKVNELLKLREIARQAKDFKKSDKLRDEIKKMGYEVKDTSSGQELSRL